MVIAKGDSAASDNYWREEDQHCLSDIVPHITPPITLPNKDTVVGTKKGLIPMHPLLSKEAATAKILPGLKSASLISIGKLCDDQCEVSFHEDEMKVVKNNTVVMTGKRNTQDNL